MEQPEASGSSSPNQPQATTSAVPTEEAPLRLAPDGRPFHADSVLTCDECGMEVKVSRPGWSNLELHKSGWKHRDALARRERERGRGDITKFITVKKRAAAPVEGAPAPATLFDWQALLAAFDAAIYRSENRNGTPSVVTDAVTAAPAPQALSQPSFLTETTGGRDYKPRTVD